MHDERGDHEATINSVRRPDEEWKTDKDKERQWLTSRDPSNLVTAVLKLGKMDSGWERWDWWRKGMRMECTDQKIRRQRRAVRQRR